MILLSCGGGAKHDAPADSTALNSSPYSLTPELNPVFLERFERGIDFVGTGNEPFWSLEVDLEGSTYFKVLDGPELTVPTPEGVQMLDVDVTRYTGRTEQGSIEVQVIRQRCIDTMSGAESDYMVRVEILAAANASPSTYEGCGGYLIDPRLSDTFKSGLHSRWTLESINNTPVKASEFAKGSPQLEFDLAGKRVMGHSGCNTISGAIEVQGNTIIFRPMITTKMACPGMEFEQAYLKMLSDTVQYRVDGSKLHLLVSADSTYTYRKSN